MNFQDKVEKCSQINRLPKHFTKENALEEKTKQRIFTLHLANNKTSDYTQPETPDVSLNLSLDVFCSVLFFSLFVCFFGGKTENFLCILKQLKCFYEHTLEKFGNFILAYM